MTLVPNSTGLRVDPQIPAAKNNQSYISYILWVYESRNAVHLNGYEVTNSLSWDLPCNFVGG